MADDRKERYINPYTVAKYSDAERRQYETSLKEYWDYTSTLETAERKGEKKGMLKEKIETARKMKADGFVVDLIAKYTGLSTEEILAL